MTGRVDVHAGPGKLGLAMSQQPDPVTADGGRARFQLERLEVNAEGELEVAGRWFGIRGRRFMRPALTMTLADGAELRALAELEHKPWAAEDGEPWIASFRTDRDPGDAVTTDLSVAPDIVVTLRGDGDGDGDGEGDSDGRRAGVTSPAPPMSRRRSSRPRPEQLERLRESLAASDRALESERSRRASTGLALEEERAESLRLRAEVARLQAELELARTAQATTAAVAAELESARREVLAAERRHDRLTREHDRTVDAHAEVRTAMHERAGALESAREALDREREQTHRLRAELAGAQEPAGPRPNGPDSSPSPSPSPSPSTARPPAVSRSAAVLDRTNWVGRVLALLFIAAVIAAVVLVIRSTI